MGNEGKIPVAVVKKEKNIWIIQTIVFYLTYNQSPIRVVLMNIFKYL